MRTSDSNLDADVDERKDGQEVHFTQAHDLPVLVRANRLRLGADFSSLLSDHW